MNYGSLVLEVSCMKRRAPPPSAKHKLTRTDKRYDMPGAPTTDDESFNLSFNQGPGKGAVVAASVMAFEADRVVNHA